MEFKASAGGDRDDVGLGSGFLETVFTILVALLESAKAFVLDAVHPDDDVAGGEPPLGSAGNIDQQQLPAKMRLERGEFVAFVAAVFDPAVENSEERHGEHAVIDHRDARGRNAGQTLFADVFSEGGFSGAGTADQTNHRAAFRPYDRLAGGRERFRPVGFQKESGGEGEFCHGVEKTTIGPRGFPRSDMCINYVLLTRGKIKLSMP